MQSRISNVSLLCWGMVFSVKLLIATSAHDLSVELAQTAQFPSHIQQRFSISSDVGGDSFSSRRIRSQSALTQPKINGGTKATGYTKNSPDLALSSSSSSSYSSSFLSSFTSSLSSSFSSSGLSSTSLSSSLVAAAAASSLSSSSSSSSLFSSSSNSVLFGRPGGNADSVTTALEYMEGTLTASQVAKCENLPLLDQFKEELDRQSFNTFNAEGSGPVWLANILTRLNLVNGPSSTSSTSADTSGRRALHSVLIRALLSQSRVLVGAAIVRSGDGSVSPNSTRYLYVYPKEDHYNTLDSVSDQRRKVYSEMLQQYLNSNNQSSRSNRSPDKGYSKISDTSPPRDRIKFKSVNFKTGSWSNIYFDCNLSKSWLLSYSAPYLDSRGAYR